MFRSTFLFESLLIPPFELHAFLEQIGPRHPKVLPFEFGMIRAEEARRLSWLRQPLVCDQLVAVVTSEIMLEEWIVQDLDLELRVLVAFAFCALELIDRDAKCDVGGVLR